jgi:hypothetical protein
LGIDRIFPGCCNSATRIEVRAHLQATNRHVALFGDVCLIPAAAAPAHFTPVPLRRSFHAQPDAGTLRYLIGERDPYLRHP